MKNIKNIIFDFGGVIINLDMETPLQLMSLHTRLNVNEVWENLQKARVFELYETGLITNDEFRNSIRNFFNVNLDDEQIDQIWNSMLLNIPPERIDILKKIQLNYRSFLLSNSNEIHYKSYLSQLQNRYKLNDFDALFEKAYFSFNIKKLKPSIEIFQWVIDEQKIKPEETLFIDDIKINTDAAQKTGLNIIHLTENIEISDLFNDDGFLIN